MQFIPVMNFQSWTLNITAVFSVTWSFRNHSTMLNCSKKILIIINVENSCAEKEQWKERSNSRIEKWNK